MPDTDLGMASLVRIQRGELGTIILLNEHSNKCP